MAKLDIDDDLFGESVPMIYVLSDARGETANTVVMAAAAQFGPDSVEIARLSNVNDVATDAITSTPTMTPSVRAPCSTPLPTARSGVRFAASSTVGAFPRSTCSDRL